MKTNEKLGSWIRQIVKYCQDYNIPPEYLHETLSEPKVIPMIRGKAFEFSAMLALKRILKDNGEWFVEKIPMNAQSGEHDIDLQVTHLPTKKIIRLECKLSKKEGYRRKKDGHHEISVKCMRSRTLGESKVKELAPKLKVSARMLTIHNDQYLPSDFDFVITSIGNAFYRTNDEGRFVWKPNEKEIEFLEMLKSFFGIKSMNLQDFAFSTMYIGYSRDIAILKSNRVKCSRKKCPSKNDCGFIPNYPIISFPKNDGLPTNGWFPLNSAHHLFEKFIKSG
jgi:hypothetical protein